MKSYEEIAQNVITRSNKIIKQKERRKKAVINTSLAASLLAVMTTGIWVIKDNGSGSNTSFPVLQNPSEDTPLPPVTDISEDISVPEISTDETSGTEIDWDTIRLNAVYQEYGENNGSSERPEEEAYTVEAGKLIKWYGLERHIELYNEKDKKFAVILFMCSKEHDLFHSYREEAVEQVKLEYKEKYDLLYYLEEQLKQAGMLGKEERSEFYKEINQKYGYSDLVIELRDLEAAARKAGSDKYYESGLYEEGQKKCLEFLENFGMHIEKRTVDVYKSSDCGSGPYGLHEEDVYSFTDEFLVSYLTVEEMEALSVYIEENGNFGLTLQIAPCFLKSDSIRAYECCHPFYMLE